MKYCALVPDPVTGKLLPYCGRGDVPIEFDAVDQAEANQLARLNRLPPAVLVLPDELRDAKPAKPRNHAHVR